MRSGQSPEAYSNLWINLTSDGPGPITIIEGCERNVALEAALSCLANGQG
jgi:hypothetical protein